MLPTARSLLLSAPVLAALAAAPPSRATPPRVGADEVSAPSTGLLPQAATRSASEAALQRLAARAPLVRALWRPGQTGPSLVTGLAERTVGSSAVERARGFVAAHADLFGVRADALGTATVRAGAGRTVVGFPQMHGGMEVWGRSVSITLDDEGSVVTVANDLASIAHVAAATVSLEDARATAARAAGAPAASDGRLVIVAGPGGAFPAAVFFAAPLGTLDAREVVVGLHDGGVASIGSATRR